MNDGLIWIQWHEKGLPYVVVTVVRTEGSVPQQPGAKLWVNAMGELEGTIGGGKIEYKAIELAQAMLLSADTPGRSVEGRTRFEMWNLQKDLGMTCGGVIYLYFECYRTKPWSIVVYGAGHVAQALIPLLMGLDCHVHCYDTRQLWLNKLPADHPKLTQHCVTDMPATVFDIDSESFVLLMTMGHGTDFPILKALFTRDQVFPYVGVIGSRAKAERLKKDLQTAEIDSVKPFYCPVGLPLGRHQPAEMAISIAAQLLQQRDTYFKSDNG